MLEALQGKVYLYRCILSKNLEDVELRQSVGMTLTHDARGEAALRPGVRAHYPPVVFKSSTFPSVECAIFLTDLPV